jgi:hypothetical protein
MTTQSPKEQTKMWADQLKMEKLAGPEGDGQLPYVNDNGLFIGPGVALITLVYNEAGRTTYAPRPKSEIDHALTAAYGMSFDSAARSGGLAAVAKALNDGQMTRAMIAALHLRLPPLPVDASDRLAKYSPDQPRDWHGRWTTGSENGSPPVKDLGEQHAAADPYLYELCMQRCDMLLERPKIDPATDVNKYDYLRCRAECEALYR